MTQANQSSKPKSRIPEFATRQEAAEWWDAHDLADYQDEFKTVEARFAANLSIEGITVPLEKEILDRLRRKAAEQGTTPGLLAQRWLVERLGQDEAADGMAAEETELVAAGTPAER